MKKIFKKINNLKDNKKRGFVVLFAIILSTVILSISMGISQIALKEVKFTLSGVDANDAFYAADAGAECAMFLDQNPNVSPFVVSGMINNTECPDLTVAPIVSHYTATVTDLTINLPNSSKKCASVHVNKYLVSGDTTINSIGRSKAQAVVGSCGPINSTIERQIEVAY